MKISIIELIGNQLSKLFPTVPIYRENQREGFKEPSFFVEKITSKIQPGMFDIQLRKYSYQIIYFPDPQQPKTDMEIVEETLLDSFVDLIDFATIRNREFNQSEDNTLQFTFEVWIRVHKFDSTIKQQRIDIKEEY
ncbi:hypothetical protein DS831_06035 [Bombilactobacillus bombi]|uniref:DUF806 family protein n=1 Tax=Bombilactobacillus bombi TaxID=1303590 RepID=A0A3R6W930_9LACO|nr:hypothetical protein [Bombilactobacillus bombi]RHW49719.1 hypothetical protein DS831_06035 [Bombilactobacillus bombi]